MRTRPILIVFGLLALATSPVLGQMPRAAKADADADAVMAERMASNEAMPVLPERRRFVFQGCASFSVIDRRSDEVLPC